MYINFEYEIWRAVAPDDSRPVLRHVLIVDSEQADHWNIGLEPGYNGLAVATDGFMLAIVPVQLEDEDVPGLVDAELIKSAGKLTPKTFPGAWLKLEPQRVTLLDQSVRPRWDGDQWPGNFPDITAILPAKRPDGRADDEGKADPGLNVHPVLSINTAYLIDLTKALGSRYIKSQRDSTHWRFLYLTPAFATPVLIEMGRRVGPTFGAWRAPLGLLMPITDTDSQDYYYEHGRPRKLGGWSEI